MVHGKHPALSARWTRGRSAAQVVDTHGDPMMVTLVSLQLFPRGTRCLRSHSKVICVTWRPLSPNFHNPQGFRGRATLYPAVSTACQCSLPSCRQSQAKSPSTRAPDTSCPQECHYPIPATVPFRSQKTFTECFLPVPEQRH